jgi:hypothetical protein
MRREEVEAIVCGLLILAMAGMGLLILNAWWTP